ncbi:hypothetical protein TrVE_jg5109 [Triparma verrucosa]|uniref:MPN domain-containing protein n=2 Tax=Triparma TaxID=722752 RepID=A0A9W7BV30_9STRA|nr:hypothetical protein TrVE_jg5109 [Triparma verrucosa]GMH92905.1 hypothetical protein TrST_g12095 [Triparma strigata]
MLQISDPTSSSPSLLLLHPTVLFSLLDSSTRHPSGQTRVLGTLLGVPSSHDPSVIEVTNSFAVPFRNDSGVISLGKDYHRQMLALLRRVNPNEKVVGWYTCTSDECLDNSASLIHSFYEDQTAVPAVLLAVDTSLKNDRLDVAAYLSNPLTVSGVPLANMFSEIALQIEAQEGERIAVEQMLKSNTAGGDPVKISAGAVVNRTAGLEQIHELLEKVQSYVTTALADPSLASEVLLRQISDAVGCIRKVDSEEFKKMIEGGLQDLLMVMYLGQVTKTQLAMAEKITATLTV